MIFLFSGFFNTTSGQPRILDYHFNSFLYGSSTGADLPFWFHSNADGKVDPESVNFLNQIGFRSEIYNTTQFRLSAGANLVARISEENSLHFSELFASAEFKGYRLSAGKFIQQIGLNNHDLSIGSMMVSRNATPIPKISLWTPDFLNVPYTNGFMQYKGLYSHGMFTEDRFVDDIFLHQKYLYLRFNFGAFSATGGVVHNSMWGGKNHPNFGRLPQSFTDYLRVITGRAAEGEAPGGEIVNVIGNSIASYDFSISKQFDSYRVSVTRMFYLEDKVSTRFRSPWDGVWGLNFQTDKNDSFIHALTYQHINTKNQDAKSFEADGRRDYYNHFLYENGWSNYERAIGIPLFIYDSGEERFSNNIVVGHHIGIKGEISNAINYKTFFTYSRNYGRNGETLPKDDFPLAPLRTDQYSFYLDFEHELPAVENITLKFGVAGDFGELHEDIVGILAGVRWNGSLKR